MLLVDTPNEGQQLYEINISGGYFDTTRVIWDERLDGPIATDIVVGGMVRKENPSRLEYSAELFDLNDPTKKPLPGDTSVSAFQLEIAIFESGRDAAAFAAALPVRTRIEWLRRDRHRRDGEVAAAMASVFSTGPKDIDQIFSAAAKVV
jgi:hypothetical protein